MGLETPALAKDFPTIDTSFKPVVDRTELRSEYSDGQAASRASQTATELRRRLTGPIVFVGHGASCLGIAEAFGRGDYIGYTSITRFASEGGRWRVVGSFGDVSHLSPDLAKQALASAF